MLYRTIQGHLETFLARTANDWALAPLQDAERRDVLEILEDRSGTHSTIVTSQLPPGQWHD